jgi:hypothetical protein
MAKASVGQPASSEEIESYISNVVRVSNTMPVRLQTAISGKGLLMQNG